MAKFKEPIEYKIGDRVEVIRQGYSSIIIGIQESLAENRRNVYITEDGTRSWSNEIEYLEVSYTNQEMIDRIEKAKSINGFVEEKVTASETQVAGNHYSKLKIQPMEYCLQNDLNYGQSNAIKYITRYKDKNGIEDLKKAIHCIELLIEFEEKDID